MINHPGVVDRLADTIKQVEAGEKIQDGEFLATVSIPKGDEETSTLPIEEKSDSKHVGGTEEDAGISTSDSIDISETASDLSQQKFVNGALVTAHQAVQQTMDAFLNTKRKFGILTVRDRPEVAAVKDAINLITNLLKQDVSQIETKYALELQTICEAYENLIRRCDEYQRFFSGLKKPSDKYIALSEMSSQIARQCEKELGQFKLVKGLYIKGQRQDAKKWIDILYSARTDEIDEKNLETVGGGTSKVYTLKHSKGVDFIKNEEKLAMGTDIPSLIQLFGEIGEEEKRAGSLILEAKNRKAIIDAIAMMRSVYGVYASKKAIIPETDVKGPVLSSENSDILKSLIGDDLAFELVEFCEKKQHEFDIATAEAGIRPGQTISDRNVSTSRVAEKLGLSEIVAESKTISITRDDGSVIRSNSMEGVVGPTIKSMGELIQAVKDPGNEKFYDKRIVFSGKAVSQLFELQILDLITGQVDRHENNYMVFFENGDTSILITGIKGIDNDMAFGEKGAEFAQNGGNILNPIVDSKGRIGIPFITKALYDRLMTPGLDLIMRYDQMDLRNQEEINALIARFSYVRNQIRELHEQGKLEVITDLKDFEQKYMDRLKKLNESGELAMSYFGAALSTRIGQERLGNFLA